MERASFSACSSHGDPAPAAGRSGGGKSDTPPAGAAVPQRTAAAVGRWSHRRRLLPLVLVALVCAAQPAAGEERNATAVYIRPHSDLLPYRFVFAPVKPYQPTVELRAIGEEHINATWLPAKYNPTDPRPTGTRGYFKFREKGEETWSEAMPLGGNLTVQLAGLEPGTEYEIVAVAVAEYDNGQPPQEAHSSPIYVKTDGIARAGLSWWWLILLLLAIIILVLILCIACVVAKARGQKYPVGEKEREAGREPMLDNEEKQFGEYNKDSAEQPSTGAESAERASLAPSQAISEADSMADYGDGNGLGRFTEDGSWIGAYVPNRQLVASVPTPESSARGPVPPPRTGKASTTLV